MSYHGRWVKVLADILGWSLAPGREGLSGLSRHEKPARSASIRGWTNYPPYSRGVALVLPNALVSLRAASWPSLFLTLWTIPFLFASLPSLASSLPLLISKQAAQKNETHPDPHVLLQR